MTLEKAKSLAQDGNLSGALRALNSVLPDSTRRPDFKIFRARILIAMGRSTDALSDIDDADTETASPRLLALRAEVEEKLGRVDAAIHTLTRALQSAQEPSLLARRCLLLQSVGDFDAAREDILHAIALRPNEGELYRILAPLHKFKKDDPMLCQIKQQSEKVAGQSPNKMGFNFALAKALDDCADYDGAFAHLKSANTAMRAQFPYDIQSRLDLIERYKKTFQNFDATDHVAPDPSDYDPIFISGMPRSGTTLVEQIISSHAHVHAGGETARFLPRMIETIGDPTSSDQTFSAEKFGVLGQRYHADMLAHLHIAKRHTDKSIQTILYAGAVVAALPKAKIILVTRNRHATELSLYKHVFLPGKQIFSYDLDDIRKYQDGFDEIAEFWIKKLPNAILPVAYEDVVSAPEDTIRKMLKFLNLEWDAACLRPEDNARAVQTLSSVAVRNSIGTKAKDHWKNYAHHLGIELTPRS